MEKAVFSVEAALRLFNEDLTQLETEKYKRLKPGGGQAYDRSSD
jgi:hypothetical protein